MTLGVAQYLVLLVALQRLAELWISNRNTRRLLAGGAREAAGGHYPLLVLLHAAWLLAVFLLAEPQGQVLWPLAAFFLLLQAARVWVIASLGRLWTTRIIVVPDAPLVRRGPYRFMRHPNYMIVAAEIAVLPLCFGLWRVALIFGLANLALLAWRIREEEKTLAPRRRT